MEVGASSIFQDICRNTTWMNHEVFAWAILYSEWLHLSPFHTRRSLGGWILTTSGPAGILIIMQRVILNQHKVTDPGARNFGAFKMERRKYIWKKNWTRRHTSRPADTLVLLSSFLSKRDYNIERTNASRTHQNWGVQKTNSTTELPPARYSCFRRPSICDEHHCAYTRRGNYRVSNKTRTHSLTADTLHGILLSVRAFEHNFTTTRCNLTGVRSIPRPAKHVWRVLGNTVTEQSSWICFFVRRDGENGHNEVAPAVLECALEEDVENDTYQRRYIWIVPLHSCHEHGEHSPTHFRWVLPQKVIRRRLE